MKNHASHLPIADTDDPGPLPEPPEVHLCQVNSHVSCGACCGLYNVADASRPALVKMLTARTKAFKATRRAVDAIFQFKQETLGREGRERPMPDFHHCPFLGFIGAERATVGCLLHPRTAGNQGMDFRSLSYYGGMTCHIYFCPATRLLPERYKQILRIVLDDWYLYGLIVTETKLLLALFEELESRMGRELYAEDFSASNARREALKHLFLLRVSWPFRAPAHSRLANYFFNDHLYARPPLPVTANGHAISRYRTILQELETDAGSEEALHQAEVYLYDRFNLVQDALESG
jgi:hypothetical protein